MNGDRCPMCGDTGWIFDSDTKKPLLELIPCVYPTCQASGRHVEHISVWYGLGFTRPVIGPDGIVMGLGR